MALNLATNPIETEDAPAILGGGAIPAAAFTPASLAPVSVPSAAVLGAAAPAAPAAASAPAAPVSILGSAAPASPLVPMGGSLAVDPKLIASAQAALARARGPVMLPETTVEGNPPQPGMGAAIPAPLKAQGGAELDQAIKGATQQAKSAVAAYNRESPVDRLTALQAQQAGERARQLAGYRGQVEGAFGSQIAGAQVATEGAVKSAEEQANAARRNKIMAATYADEAETNLDAARAAKDEAEATRRKADEDFGNAKIDLDKAYGDSGQRLMSSVAIALGAFGSSLTGGPNFAMQLVNDRINRVIDAQKAEIEKKKTQASNAAQLYRDMVNVYGDERTATEAYRAKLLDSTIQYAKAKYAPALEQGKGLEIIGRMEAERNNALQNVDQAIQQNAQAKAAIPVEAKARQAIAASAAAAATAKARQAHEFKLEEIHAEGTEHRATKMAEQIAEGQGPKAEAEGVKAFQDSMKSQGVANVAEAENALNAAREALEKHGPKFESALKRQTLKGGEWTPDFLDGPAGREYKQDLTRSYLMFHKAVTGTGGSEKEAERIEQATGGLNPALVRRFIDNEMSILRRQKQNALSAVPSTVRDRVAESQGINASFEPGELPAGVSVRGAR